MHNHGNVVPLYKATTGHTTRAPLARLPVILLQVRDKATQQLRHGLQELFNNADDTLFEMADGARNDVDHNIFFEAMRDLRLKRKSIERFFFEQFFQAFISLTQYSATHTVLANDPPERSVAVETMVNNVLSRDGFALDQLTARLSTLLGRSLMEQHNPMGPTMLCEFFLQAGRNLGMEIRVKLIILKLFERYVLSTVDKIYADANQLLIATGVLPDLKPAPTRRTTEPVLVQEQLDEGIDADEFLAFTSDERRRSELLEQRLRDAEDGLARTALARQSVETALNQALLCNVLPRSVLVFVRDTWSNVLLLTCLKHGEQSMQWQANVQTLEQLIWSVQHHDELDAGSRLLEMVPGLLKALRDGLSGSAFDSFAASGFFSELESVHVQLFERRKHLPADHKHGK